MWYYKLRNSYSKEQLCCCCCCSCSGNVRDVRIEYTLLWCERRPQGLSKVLSSP